MQLGIRLEVRFRLDLVGARCLGSGNDRHLAVASRSILLSRDV
jgi:hypothetical protein